MKKTFALLALASLTAFFGCSSEDSTTDQLTHECPAGDAAADGGPSTTRPEDDAGDDAVAPVESDADTDATVPPAADAAAEAAVDAAAE